MIKLINKLITHNRDKVGDFGIRVIIHIPIGYIIGWAWVAHWILPLALVYLFVRYEENEDLHTKDQGWKDYFGALVGLVLAIFTWIWLRLT